MDQGRNKRPSPRERRYGSGRHQDGARLVSSIQTQANETPITWGSGSTSTSEQLMTHNCQSDCSVMRGQDGVPLIGIPP